MPMPSASSRSRPAASRPASPRSRAARHSARTLGETATGAFRRVHLPLIRPALGAAAILVFVDCMKELPATLLLRPLNFETLATHLYGEASRGTYEDGADRRAAHRAGRPAAGDPAGAGQPAGGSAACVMTRIAEDQKRGGRRRIMLSLRRAAQNGRGLGLSARVLRSAPSGMDQVYRPETEDAAPHALRRAAGRLARRRARDPALRRGGRGRRRVVRRGARGDRGAGRPFRVGQVDAAPPHRRARAARRGTDHRSAAARWRRSQAASRPRSAASA